MERTARVSWRTDKRFRVDAEAGVIYNARIIGTVSANGRKYPIDVLRKRFKMYENQHVYANHSKGKGARPMQEWAGVTRDTRPEADGVFGDVHCFKDTPAGRMLLEAALKAPDQFGLSPQHYIDFVTEADGTELVVDIAEVVSVDAVTRPATNKNLWESRSMASERQEQDGATAPAPMVMSIEDAIANLEAAITGNPDLESEEKMALWKKVVKLKNDILGTGGDDPADEPAGGDAVPVAGGGAGEAVQAAHAHGQGGKGKTRLGRVERELREMRIERLADKAGVALTPTQLEALVGLSTQAVYEEIEAYKRQQRRPYNTGTPRSSGRQETPEGGRGPAAKHPPMLTKGATREEATRFYRGS